MRKFFKKRSKKILSIFLLLPFIAQTFITPLLALDEILPEIQVEEAISETQVDIPIDTSEDILEEGISDPEWVANPEVLEEEIPKSSYENGVYTVNKVELEEYVYPDNENVKVKFTSITQEGNLVISKVKLTEEEKEKLNTSDDYGWDISSSMSNGSFTYNLTLPNTQGKDVEVKYTEDGTTYESIDNVDVNENVIYIEGLEHFTVFVVVDADVYTTQEAQSSACSTIYTSHGGCYTSINAAIAASSNDGTIYIGAGTYSGDPILINKAVTILGPNNGKSGRSSNRSAEARIQNTGITITAPAVIDGVEIYQTDNTADAILIQAAATVKNSIIRRNGATTGEVGRGITTAVGISGYTIKNNLFTGDPSSGVFGNHKTWNSCIYLNGGTGTISWNTFENCRTAINADDFNSGITISENIFRNSGTYLSFGGVTPTDGQYTISGNEFYVDWENLATNWLPSTLFNNSKVAATFRVNATGNTFGGKATNDLTLDQKFQLEGRMFHRGRGGNKLGVIDFVPNEQIVVNGQTTIQSAIDAARPNDTVHVSPGTYNEHIVVNKSLNLYGAQANVDPRPSKGGRTGNETIINGGGSQIMKIDADNVKINGFEFVNGGGYMIEQVNSHSNYIFQYNIVHNQNGDDAVKVRTCNSCLVSNNYIYGIAFPGDGIGLSGGTGCSISYNELRDQSSENAAIYVYDSTNTKIIENIVNGTTKNDGIKLGDKDGSDALGTGGEIKNNIVSNTTQDGISVYMSNVVVDGNDISGSSSINGALYLAFGISNVSITHNKIHGNSSAQGIKIESPVNATTIKINNNQIFNNTNYGLYNFANTLVDAKSNWWGDNSGPHDEWNDESNPPTNNSGIGNAVKGMVDYSNWTIIDTTTPQINNLKYYKNGNLITTPSTTPIFVKSIDELTYGADYHDNLGLNRTAFVIWDATDTWNPVSNSHKCNWNGSPSTTILNSSTSQTLSGVPLKKCNPSYSWPSGKYIISHVVYDNVGNYSYNTGGSQRFIIDNIAPSVSFTGQTPENGSYVKGNITGHVTATDNVGMGSYYIRIWKNAFDSGTENLVKECYSAPGGNLLGTSQDIDCSFDTATVPDGKYVFSAQFLDSSSNWGTAFRTFYVDNGEPTIQIDNAAPKSFYGSSDNLGVHILDDNVGSTYFFKDGSTTPDRVYGNDCGSNQPCEYFGIGWLSEGKYLMYHIDQAGNKSEEYTFTIDKTAPVGGQLTMTTTLFPLGITVANPDSNGVYPLPDLSMDGVDVFQSLKVVVTDTNLDTTKVQVYVDETPNGYMIFDSNTEIWNYGEQLGRPNFSSGTHNLVATFKDKAGNPKQLTARFTTDNTAPEVTLTSPLDNYYTKQTAVRQEWTADATDIHHYEYRSCSNDPDIDGNCTKIHGENTGTNAFRTANNNNISFHWQVRAVDLAGNVGNWSSARKITIDGVGPTVSFSGLRHYDYRYPLTPVDTINTSTNDNTPIVLISASDSLSGMDYVTVNGQTATYDGSTYWIVELTTLSDGAKTLEIVGTDKAGNKITISQDIFIDTKAPEATYTYYRNGTAITDPIAYVKGVDELSFTAQYSDGTQSSGILKDTYVIFNSNEAGTARTSVAYCKWRDSANTLTILNNPNLFDIAVPFTNCEASLADGAYFIYHQVYDKATRKDIPSITQYRDVKGLHFVVDSKAPEITISDYNTNLTNQPIIVNATTNEGSLIVESHTFTENGSFDFIATDMAGNVTTKTVTISNIDNILPTGETAILGSFTLGSAPTTLLTLEDNNNLNQVCYSLNGVAQPCITISGTSYDWDITDILNNMGVGSSVLSYYVVDQAGNQSDSNTVTTESDQYTATVNVLAVPTQTPAETPPTGEVQGVSTGPTPKKSPTYYAQTTNINDIEEENTTDETEMEVETTEEEVLGETTCEATYKISGTIYYDKNENGKYDEEEDIVEGIEVNIYNSDKELEKTVTTDEKGHWEATLCPGEYTTQVERAEDQTIVLGDSDTTLDISVEKKTNWWLIVVGGVGVLILLKVLVDRSKKKEEI